MKILISGKPGVGKTTLLFKLFNQFRDFSVGFFTKEIRKNGKRVGFKIVTSYGFEGVFARKGERGSKVYAGYTIFIDVLDKVVEEIKARIDKGKILFIDEIGKMEMLSSNFVEFVDEAMKSREICVVASVHRALVRRYRALATKFYWLTEENRERVFEEVKLSLQSLVEARRGGHLS